MVRDCSHGIRGGNRACFDELAQLIASAGERCRYVSALAASLETRLLINVEVVFDRVPGRIAELHRRFAVDIRIVGFPIS